MSEQMTLVKHKFRDHQIQADTEILIIGTFNPDAAKNNADFFLRQKSKAIERTVGSAACRHIGAPGEFGGTR